MDREPCCAVCRELYDNYRCQACDQLNCPRGICSMFVKDSIGDLTTAAGYDGWLCSHCVEEVLYGP